jgi:cytochrome c peroxidase
MAKFNHLAYGFLTITALAIGCQEETGNLGYESDALKLPTKTLDYNLPTKEAANGVVYTDNATNPITDDGATLGRVLFYDKKLSLNNQVACASCHHQENGFADPVALSTGFQGQKTTRNASTIVNAGLEHKLFWDMRANTIEDLSLRPVSNHIEMGIEDMSKLSEKLAKISYYPDLFAKAYGTKDINGERISKAVSQFLRSMVSYSSKFDESKKNNFANFTASELRGKDLFMKKLHCGNCHGGDNLNTAISGEESFNIGLDVVYNDNGVGLRTGDRNKNGAFKVPSLRNVELTGPYMHDGRFKTLEEVVEHYNQNMKLHENLFPSLRSFTWEGNGGGLNSGGSIGWGSSNTNNSFNTIRGLQLTPQNKTDLVAFMKTLTDQKMVNDERFSSPFEN